MVKLIVWQVTNKRTRKLEYDLPTHAEASKLARNMFKGMRTKIIDKGERKWGRMRSYCDMMSERGMI